MSYKYDMKHYTFQQKAIVGSSDQVKQKLIEKQNPDYINMNIWGYKIPSATYEEVSFYKNAKLILELRVSLVAIFHDPCGLKELDIHRWLWETGNMFVDEINEDKCLTLMIRANDVNNGKLVSSWSNLGRE